MGKRSRRERREGQARRALEGHDPAFFEKLAQTNPEMAAQHLAAVLADLPVDEPSPLDGIAASLCARLRRGQNLAAAKRLAAAGSHRAQALRLEHALAAFALGDDAEAQQAAAADPAVEAIMAPLLEAARAAGGVPPSPAASPAAEDAPAPAAAPRARAAGRRSKGPASGASPELAGLHGVAAAATAAMRGQIRAAREALRRVPGAVDATSLAPEMHGAIAVAGEISSPKARADTARLRRSPLLKASTAARESFVWTLARTSAREALEAGRAFGMSAEALRPLRLRVLAEQQAGSDGATGARAVLELVRTAGADVFDPEHRAVASLYEGFACLHSDPKRADRALDRAVELGADIVEALRGKMLLAMSDAGAACSECGVRHPRSASEKSGGAGAAADRFARAVRRLPMGAPFAAAASLLAAQQWDSEGNTRAALAALQAARDAAGGGGSAELDLREAGLLQREHPDRAAALLDRLIANDPRDARPWRMKIDLATRSNDTERERDLLAQAAAATGDAELVARARAARVQRGEVAPFEGLVPGAVTAGALAAEAAAFLSAPGPARELPPAALACRAALAPTAQLAFDVALVATDVTERGHADAQARFAATLGAWWGSPSMLAKLAVTAWYFGMEQTLEREAKRRAHDDGSAAALAALFAAAIGAEDPDVASRMLTLGSARWTHAEVRERKAAVERLRLQIAEGAFPSPGGHAARPGAPAFVDPDAVWRELEAAVAPEFEIPDDLDDDDLDDDGYDDDEYDDDEYDDGNPFGPVTASAMDAMLRVTFEMMGLAPSLLNRLSAAKKAEILALLGERMRGAPTQAKISKLKQETLKLLGKGGA